MLFKLPPGSLESLLTMCAEMYFICFRGEPSSLSDLRLHSQLYWWPSRESGTTQSALLMTSQGVRDHTTSSAEDQPGSQGPHDQLCWWPARESRTTQPTLLMTSPGLRDHTTSSAEDQPGSQWSHSQLCWGPSRESGTTQPTLLMTSLESGTTQPALLRTSPGVRDHTANSADDQPGSQGPHSQLYWGPDWESGTTQPALLWTSPGVRDHTANSAEEQPGSHGPHGLLCWKTAWESRTTAPVCDQPIEEWRSYSGKNWLIRQGVLIRDS